MSYLVLARKSRPQTFEEVVGQRPVVKTLQNSLKRNRVAHAILFSGVRGVGKTTLARLMAKALNCQKGPTTIPCNQCLSCKQIMEGASLDLYEIDGASNRGIQEVRELKEKIKYLPTSSAYKIVIIDEVHMLTTEAFNALLKTLEEPPAHVYFMFATTELQKIPITILSRCQRYELKRVNSEELSKHFTNLASHEGIELESGALSLIVREAEGSVRDGLSLLDQVFSYGESPIKTDDVVEMLGLVNRDVLNNISQALLAGDKASALENLAETFKFGMDTKRFMADLLDCFRSLLLVKLDGCSKLLDISEEDLKTLQATAEQFSIESIHQKLSLLMQTAEDLRYSLQPRLVLETAFLSIIESGNIVPLTTLLETLDKTIVSLPDQPPATEFKQSAPPVISQETKKKITDIGHVATPQASPPVPETEISHGDNSEPPWKVEEPPMPEESPSPASAQHPPKTAETVSKTTPRDRNISKDWLDFISFVKEQKPGMGHNLLQASAIKEQDSELLIDYNNSEDCTILTTDENRKILANYVFEFFGKHYDIRYILPEEIDDKGMENSTSPKEQRKKLATHPLVQMTEDILGGQVGDIRISTRKQ